MADETTLADIIAAAFLAGVKEEAKKQAKSGGKRIVRGTISAAKEGLEIVDQAEKKVKRKASAYAMKYGRAFKQVAKDYKTKSGSWKKDGFKRAQKAAHKKAKGMRK